MRDLQNSTHLHEDDLELYVRGRLEPAHTSTLESHLSVCEKCRERFSESLGLRLSFHSMGRDNQRSEPRFSAGDHAIIQELSPFSLDRWQVRIVDVSKNGLGLLAPKAILPGTIVQVRIKDTVEFGEVRHCKEGVPQEYRIGLRLNRRP